MRIWKGDGVLHGYGKITGLPDEVLDIPEAGIRDYASGAGLFVCMCLEHKLAGNPDPRLVFVAAGGGE